MADARTIDRHRTGESDTPPTPDVREARDAEDHKALKRDPAHADSKLEIGLDESFPTSDPPAGSRPGSADPAPSSGFDEATEAGIAREREKEK